MIIQKTITIFFSASGDKKQISPKSPKADGENHRPLNKDQLI